MKKQILGLLFVSLITWAETVPQDEWIWLEEVDGINPLAWVNGQNLRTAAELKSKPEFESLHKEALEVLNAATRIPSLEPRGKWLYNLWRDEKHPRGIYRRTTIEEFQKAEPQWESVLDVDALSRKENKPWVFHGMDCLEPEYRHCLVSLAPGGSDASEIREFDMTKLAFVKEGFFVPVSKSSASWIDVNSIFVSPDTGPGSVTESGYPRTVKIWKRGTPLTEAQKIYEGNVKSVSCSGSRIRTDAGNIDLVKERTSFGLKQTISSMKENCISWTFHQRLLWKELFERKLVLLLVESWKRGGENRNTEGGHGASSTNEQLAYRLALAYTHLWQRLK